MNSVNVSIAKKCLKNELTFCFLTKGHCDLDLWPIDLKRILDLYFVIINLCTKNEFCHCKCIEKMSRKQSDLLILQKVTVTLNFDLLMSKHKLDLYFVIIHLCTKYEFCNCKHSEKMCGKQSVDGRTDGQTDGQRDYYRAPAKRGPNNVKTTIKIWIVILLKDILAKMKFI